MRYTVGYTLSYEFEIEADSPREAAVKALRETHPAKTVERYDDVCVTNFVSGGIEERYYAAP